MTPSGHMNTEQFAKLFRTTKDELISEYSNGNGTSVSKRIAALNLSAQQKSEIIGILDDALTDALYTSLMGLGGAASIGGVQQGYTISDEEGRVICRADDGELEASAWLAFQSDRK